MSKKFGTFISKDEAEFDQLNEVLFSSSAQVKLDTTPGQPPKCTALWGWGLDANEIEIDKRISLMIERVRGRRLSGLGFIDDQFDPESAPVLAQRILDRLKRLDHQFIVIVTEPISQSLSRSGWTVLKRGTVKRKDGSDTVLFEVLQNKNEANDLMQNREERLQNDFGVLSMLRKMSFDLPGKKTIEIKTDGPQLKLEKIGSSKTMGVFRFTV